MLTEKSIHLVNKKQKFQRIAYTKLIVILIFAFLHITSAFSQAIYGTVADQATSEPLTGASLKLMSQNTGTVSSHNGKFSLKELKPGTYTLQCSYVGYQPKEKEIRITDNDVEVHFELQRNIRKINEIIVRGNLTGPVKRTGDLLFTGTAITKKGISLIGTSGANSVYNTLDIIPGIAVENNDAWGLSGKTVRIRGIRSTFSGMTIEGFPNYGIMPIGARDDIYDMENMESVSVYKGAAPADLGTATGSKGGVIELKYDRPADSLRIKIKQMAGSSAYLRSFARVDLGQLTETTTAFVSLSRTRADKWKGKGTLGPRNNAALGIVQSFGEQTTLSFFANYNSIDRHHFRELDFEHASDIKNSYNTDYNSTLSGNPAQDLHFFDYNRGSYTNGDIMMLFSHYLAPALHLNLKSYYSHEDALFNESVKRGPNFFVLDRKRNTERTGIIPEIKKTGNHLNFTLGYWYESADNNANVYNNRISSEGLIPMGYGFYTVNDRHSRIHSPYLKLARSAGKFHLQGGLKYFWYREPAANRYTSEAPDQLSSEPNPNLNTDEMTYQALLPSIGLGYQINNQLNTYFNYGRNYMRPYMYNPIISLYTNNMETFSQHNMTLQNIFDDWTMETSDNIDLGIRYHSGMVSLSSSIFWAKHYDVLVSAYNPEIQLDYFQNAGQLTAYGTDVELYIKPAKQITVFLNPAWTSMNYDKDLKRGGQTIGIKGNQAPATPEFSLKSGISWSSPRQLNASLFLKHIGSRYGDATNTEKLDAYTISNFKADYSLNNFFYTKNLKISFEVNNIFNKQYVGAIDVSDDANNGSASYYPGAPRTITAGMMIIF